MIRWGESLEVWRWRSTDKIDNVVLALLHLKLDDGARAWKGHDWRALHRLRRKEMIYDPVGKQNLSRSRMRAWLQANGYFRRCRHYPVGPTRSAEAVFARARERSFSRSDGDEDLSL